MSTIFVVQYGFILFYIARHETATLIPPLKLNQGNKCGYWQLNAQTWIFYFFIAECTSPFYIGKFFLHIKA